MALQSQMKREGRVPDRDVMVKAIETYCRAEVEQNKAMWMDLFAEEIVHEDPVNVVTRRGLGELESLWALIAAGKTNLWLTDDVIVCGHEAIALMACETGPADARRRTGPIVDLFVFNEAGKITNVRAFYKFN
jgi:steroid Delta-isomerase